MTDAKRIGIVGGIQTVNPIHPCGGSAESSCRVVDDDSDGSLLFTVNGDLEIRQHLHRHQEGSNGDADDMKDLVDPEADLHPYVHEGRAFAGVTELRARLG